MASLIRRSWAPDRKTARSVPEPVTITYDRDAVVQYALDHTNTAIINDIFGNNYVADYLLSNLFDRNPMYYSYGSNCASFTSQALHAGGIEMDEGWYSYGTPIIPGLHDYSWIAPPFYPAGSTAPLTPYPYVPYINPLLNNYATEWDVTLS